jgi:hypothetical protein
MEDHRLDSQIEISGAVHSSPNEYLNLDLFPIYEHLLSLDLEELKNLCSRINSSNPTNIVPEKLTLLEFEMLEAELRNQGILQKNPEKISQNISREISQLTWSVRHHLKSNQELVIFINVPKYILKKTISNVESLNSESKLDEALLQELRYFNQFANYLNGAYENVETAYERGLNIVLKSIRSGSQINEKSTENHIEIIYPIDRKTLMKELLNFD